MCHHDRQSAHTGGAAISTEQALLDAAERVLVERGLQATKVEDITSEAGVAKGTFYLYFATKEDVIRAVQRRHFQTMLDNVAESAARLHEADFWAVADALIDTMVAYDLEHRQWYRKVVQGWAPPPSEFANERADMQHLVATAIKQGIADGHCADVDTDVTSLLLCSAIEGSLHQICMTEADPDASRLAAGLKDFVRRVLSPRPTD
ncbi:MAG TPA: TetR/AcrR family transcriptional regulator [Egibacteraceae bacterium]|nr:TetR/AcrR family transcriptional regulator [Egibacteraceae bacterium]